MGVFKKLVSSQYLMSHRSLSIFLSSGFFLILCAKFYYLLGVSHWPMPDAPLGLILVRDLIVIIFLTTLTWQLQFQIRQDKLFWLLWSVGFAVSLLQLMQEKDLLIWLQHYFRNVLIPLLFYPVIRQALHKSKFYFNTILFVFFILDITISYVQVYLSPYALRPPGILGDPIINSMILMWSVVAIFLTQMRWLFFLSVLLLVPLLQYLSSVSSLLAFIFGCGTIVCIYRQIFLLYCKKNFKMILMAVAGLILLSGVASHFVKSEPEQSFNSITSKIELMYQSIECSGKGCEHWSYAGRVQSNLKPFKFCSEDFIACLIGNQNSDRYERLEATWAALVVNWGLIFCTLYFVWIFQHIYKVIKNKNLEWEDKEYVLSCVIFFSCLYFQFMNSIHHKFPINILFYASMAYISFKKKDQV